MRDLDVFFEHDADRYMASDVDAVSALYEAPLLAVREGRAIHLGDRAAVREHLTDVMGADARSGAARADVAGIDVATLGASSVAATVLLVDGQWQILAYTNHGD